jgi:hypothetical protein
MQGSPNKPTSPVIIPSRLHTGKRSVIKQLENNERLYIRHTPLEDGQEYAFEIPGHSKLEDQSANSNNLNQPSGYACDVLYDTNRGLHYFQNQIACIDLRDISTLSLPNENTIIKDSQGNVTTPADTYSFTIKHDPTPLMFPHCIIQAKKNGQDTQKINSKAVKTKIRNTFAELAEKNREHMNSQRISEFTKWKAEHERLSNPTWFNKLVYKFRNFLIRFWGMIRGHR